MVVAVAPRVGGLSVVPIAAVLLALIGLALLMGRRWTRTSQHAETDSLTGLGNRRKLDADLSRLLAGADESKQLTLCAYDLNGFKNYNDSFGHPAGDALLGRFGARLATAAGAGNAYRLGGDEFCVVVAAAVSSVDEILAATLEALSDYGEGWEIDCAYGTVVLPTEARDVERRPAARRPAAVRGQAGGRRSVEPPEHRRAPAGAARARPGPRLRTCTMSGISPQPSARGSGSATEDLDVLRLAGELHDIGKVAIPDAIMSKPGPLDPAEWAIVRQHTIIGERILAAAPALEPGRQARPLEPRGLRRHGLPGRHGRRARSRSARESWPSATPSTP